MLTNGDTTIDRHPVFKPTAACAMFIENCACSGEERKARGCGLPASILIAFVIDELCVHIAVKHSWIAMNFASSPDDDEEDGGRT